MTCSARAQAGLRRKRVAEVHHEVRHAEIVECVSRFPLRRSPSIPGSRNGDAADVSDGSRPADRGRSAMSRASRRRVLVATVPDVGLSTDDRQLIFYRGPDAGRRRDVGSRRRGIVDLERLAGECRMLRQLHQPADLYHTSRVGAVDRRWREVVAVQRYSLANRRMPDEPAAGRTTRRRHLGDQRRVAIAVAEHVVAQHRPASGQRVSEPSPRGSLPSSPCRSRRIDRRSTPSRSRKHGG